MTNCLRLIEEASASVPRERIATCTERLVSSMSEQHRITFNPEQNGGRPSIRGMRIRVVDVLELIASGASREEILDDYPYLEPEDITAALEFAAQQVDHRVPPNA
jgi:uncharacterized protein (DUF433 family)